MYVHVHVHVHVQVLSLIQQSLRVSGGQGGVAAAFAATPMLNQSDFEAASSALSDLIVKCAPDPTLHDALHMQNIYYTARCTAHTRTAAYALRTHGQVRLRPDRGAHVRPERVRRHDRRSQGAQDAGGRLRLPYLPARSPHDSVPPPYDPLPPTPLRPRWPT